MSNQVAGHITFTVGRLLAGQVRDFLKAMKWRGYDIDWLEDSGWIERTFTIRYSAESNAVLRDALTTWKHRIENAKG